MHCFKFPTRTHFRALAKAEGLITEEGELITASHSHAIDEIGTIVKDDIPRSGWHVNYAGEPPEAWEEYLVTPQHPARVFFGGDAQTDSQH
jgi:hypothetical protein